MVKQVTVKMIEEAHKAMKMTRATCTGVAVMAEMLIETPSDAHDPHKIEDYRDIQQALIILRRIRERAASDYERLCYARDVQEGVLP